MTTADSQGDFDTYTGDGVLVRAGDRVWFLGERRLIARVSPGGTRLWLTTGGVATERVDPGQVHYFRPGQASDLRSADKLRLAVDDAVFYGGTLPAVVVGLDPLGGLVLIEFEAGLEAVEPGELSYAPSAEGPPDPDQADESAGEGEGT